MRFWKAVIILTCVVFAASTAMAAEAGGGLRYSITVTKFDNKSGWGNWDIGSGWSTVMTDMLQQTGRFIVLGETDMRAAAMDEQDFGASGRTAGGGKTPVTGQMTPAQLLVKGAITHVQDDTAGGGAGIAIHGIHVGGRGGKGEVNATVYIVDSTTGQVLASKSFTGVSTQKGLSVGVYRYGGAGEVSGFKNDNVGKAIQAACADAVDYLVKQLPSIPWTGTVVQSAGGKVYINRGTREGVGVGQTFVVGDATVVRDPDTGEVLDSTMNEIARLKVDQVKEKVAICSVESGKSAGIRKGMAVHPAQ